MKNEETRVAANPRSGRYATQRKGWNSLHLIPLILKKTDLLVISWLKNDYG